MPFAEDQHPVGDLGPGGEYEPFRVSVRARAAAEAAGTAAAQANTPPVTAARTAVKRRSHAPALSRVTRLAGDMNMIGSCCSDLAGRSGLTSRLSQPAGGAAAA
jgi:hypothetical protein